MQALDQLDAKVDVLLRKYAALVAENKRLRETIAGQNKALDALNAQLSSLEDNMTSINVGRAVAGAEGQPEMRKQLDMVIADIDKILNTLND